MVHPRVRQELLDAGEQIARVVTVALQRHEVLLQVHAQRQIARQGLRRVATVVVLLHPADVLREIH